MTTPLVYPIAGRGQNRRGRTAHPTLPAKGGKSALEWHSRRLTLGTGGDGDSHALDPGFELVQRHGDLLSLPVDLQRLTAHDPQQLVVLVLALCPPRARPSCWRENDLRQIQMPDCRVGCAGLVEQFLGWVVNGVVGHPLIRPTGADRPPPAARKAPGAKDVWKRTTPPGSRSHP